MKFSQFLTENDETQKIIDELKHALYHTNTTTPEIVAQCNALNPPNLKVQEWVFDNIPIARCFHLINVQQPLLNKMLTNKHSIEYYSDEIEYFIKNNFKDNQLLMNKWLRYIKEIRGY